MRRLLEASAGRLALLAALTGVMACKAHESGASAGQGGNQPGGGSSGANGGGGAIGIGGNSTEGTDVSVMSALPPLPGMRNVKASATDDLVDIRFDPVDGARDYRVYVLPPDSDISNDGAGGHVTVKNAIYRCAGDRQAPRAVMDGEPAVQGLNVRTLVDGRPVEGFTRALADATLGYVYVKPGNGRVPVYAMGDPGSDADTDCDFTSITTRWRESRVKRYVTSESERAMLLGQRWRDDGIVFYVPAAMDGNSRPLYTAVKGQARLYWVDGPEASARGGGDVAFPVLTAGTDPDAQPLMRVFYQSLCGRPHDELVAGKTRFERARRQGDQQPELYLTWSGITGETTLVVEALAEGCPYQGAFAPESKPARAIYPRWMTLEELRGQSPTGEVYVNGQHAATNNPRPIARSFVKIRPGAKPDLDWFAGFNSPEALGTLATTPCGVDNCFMSYRVKSPTYDIGFIYVEPDRWTVGTALGQLWVNYADFAADTNGKFRVTPSQKAQLSADKFLYTTMSVDAFTTLRRYPQIIISDQDAPVQYRMPNGYALVIQTFSGWPYQYQLEVCDHHFWDVNSQCPAFDFYHAVDPNDPAKRVGLLPAPEVGEETGVDRMTRFEAYVSTKRAYLFLNGQPYGCANLPAVSVPAGPVTVTYGDVLYHSGVDFTFNYTKRVHQTSMLRRFDNLGFKSGTGAPPWDENRFPCVSTLKK